MHTGKKILNVLGIILSAVISIVLVLVLMVTPLLLSTLSLLHPETLVDTVTKVDMESVVMAAVEQSGEGLDPQLTKQISKLLSTDAAKKIMKTYTRHVVDTLAGKMDTQGLTEEMLRQIVDEHQDEISQALRESGGEFESMSDQELQEGIQKVVDENAAEVLQMLPDPQEMKQELAGANPQLELGLQLVTAVNTIKMILIGVVAVLCLVIFFCRFVNMRGMKWLAVDLLIAGVISGAVGVGLTQWKTLLLFIAEENPLVHHVMEVILGSVNTGLLIRTGVMLVVAIGLLVGYILICKNKKMKLAAANTPAAEQKAEPAGQVPTQSADSAEPTT